MNRKSVPFACLYRFKCLTLLQRYRQKWTNTYFVEILTLNKVGFNLY